MKVTRVRSGAELLEMEFEAGGDRAVVDAVDQMRFAWDLHLDSDLDLVRVGPLFRRHLRPHRVILLDHQLIQAVGAAVGDERQPGEGPFVAEHLREDLLARRADRLRLVREPRHVAAPREEEHRGEKHHRTKHDPDPLKTGPSSSRHPLPKDKPGKDRPPKTDGAPGSPEPDAPRNLIAADQAL